MLRRLKASFLWAGMIRSYKIGDYVKAKARADEYRKLTFPNAAFRALDATIDILNHHSDIARTKFSELVEYLENIPGDDSLYIKLYSRYYLCLIDKRSDCELLRLEAQQVNASLHLRGWLPLPRESVPIDC